MTERHTQRLHFLSYWKVERITGTSKKRSLLSVLTSSTQGLFSPIRNNARKVQVKIARSLYAGMLNKKKNSGYL